MSGNPLQPFQSLKARLKEASRKSTILEASRSVALSDLESRKDELLKATLKVEDLQKVEEVLKALLDILVTRQVKVIEEIVTEGFRSIFFDQNLNFKAEISQKYGKISIDFYIEQLSSSGVLVRGAPLESFGGGPASIASLLLRVLTMRKTKNYPLLLLDESLAAVADIYIENTSKFLKTLSEETNIPLLLISHKNAYIDYSSRAYLGDEVTDLDGRHIQLTKVQDAK